jgi:uncharacterized protein (DUF1778 family)
MAREPTTARLEARLPADVHKLLKRAAEIQGRSLTDFVVAAAHEAACRAIAEGPRPTSASTAGFGSDVRIGRFEL